MKGIVTIGFDLHFVTKFQNVGDAQFGNGYSFPKKANFSSPTLVIEESSSLSL